MTAPSALEQIRALSPYVPGLSIEQIRQQYGLEQVIKLASNENPLGAPPLAREAICRHAAYAFRYPQGGNPRLAQALADWHGLPRERLVIGNGSDEIIDLLIRMFCKPGRHNIVCFLPCFSIYPIQAKIAGVEARRQPLAKDFSFNFSALLDLADENTRLAFITTPDNPSGYCPPLAAVAEFAERLAHRAPAALLVIDEAYMDFAREEKAFSLLANHVLPDNVAFLRTFSKSFGLAGMRIGYGVLPAETADCFWRARLPFSLNILAEEAALAALADEAFRHATLETVWRGRQELISGLRELGCETWPSQANFVMFRLPAGAPEAHSCFESLLAKGIIIRPLKSYELPEHFRVSVGTSRENAAFLKALAQII